MQLLKQDLTHIFVTPGQNWSNKSIMAALEKKGASLHSVAEELGISEGTLRNVFYRPVPAYENAIARKIGVSPETIWPDRCRHERQLTA